MPEIEQSFQVDRPLATVLSFFDDVPSVADCMPGVELLEDLGSDSFKGRMKVKVGPMTATFLGEAIVTSRDEDQHAGAISAKGADQQGGSRASAEVRYSVTSDGSATRVEIVADVRLQGAMARFGRTGLIQEISTRLTQEFAECIRAKLSASSASEAAHVQAREVRGIRLFFSGLWGWLKRLIRHDG